MKKSWITMCATVISLWGFCSCHMPGGGERSEQVDHRYFIRAIFRQYGDQDIMTLDGFEHLLSDLGMGNVVFEDHSISYHRDGENRFTNFHVNHNHYRVLVNSSSKGGPDSREKGNKENVIVPHDKGSHSNEPSPPKKPSPLQQLIRQDRGTKGEIIENLTDIFESHEEMEPSVVEYYLPQCLTPTEILKTFEITNDIINPLQFLHLCPAIVHQLGQKQCREDGVHIEHIGTEAGWPGAEVWLSSTLAIFIISVCGFVCVLTVPLLPKGFFKTIQQLFIGLAIGALPGDAMLHLLPHAMSGEHEHEEEGHDDTILIWKGFTALMGIFLFLLCERLLGIISSCNIFSFRSKKVPTEEPIVGKKLSEHKRDSVGWTEASVKMDPKEIGPESKGLLPKAADNMDPEIVFIDPEKDHHHHHHGHGHSHDSAVFSSFSAMAMMVIMGDGLHNMCDGLAIGTAFSKSIATGISTAIAVFCHELPHEMGDFAILLSMGLTKKQAFICNIISSVLCYVATIIGIFLGSSLELNTWIFLITAGIFLYLALAVMMPTVKDPSTTDKDFLIAAVGIGLGVSIMVTIAMYERQLKSLFS